MRRALATIFVAAGALGGLASPAAAAPLPAQVEHFSDCFIIVSGSEVCAKGTSVIKVTETASGGIHLVINDSYEFSITDGREVLTESAGRSHTISHSRDGDATHVLSFRFEIYDLDFDGVVCTGSYNVHVANGVARRDDFEFNCT